MRKTIGRTVRECVLDLGITVVYAALVGLLIAAIVASDDGPVSLLKATLYASLLPASVIVLILIDLGLRLVAEARAARRRIDAAFVRPSRAH